MKTRLNHIYLGLVCIIGLPLSSLKANISGLFKGSIPFESSGGFSWSIWDYLTNPYIFSVLEEKNVLSAMVTSVASNGNYSLAGKNTIASSVPLFWAFQLNGQESVYTELDEGALISQADVNPTALNDLKNYNYTLLIGSVIPFTKIGLGLYGRLSKYEKKTTTGSASGPITTISYQSNTNQEEVLRGNLGDRFGIEAGEFRNYTQWLPISWNLNVEYRIFKGGSSREAEVKEFEAYPGFNFLNSKEFSGKNIDSYLLRVRKDNYNNRLFPPVKFDNSNRRELNYNFLGWYALSKNYNAGMYLQSYYIIPSSGRGFAENSLNPEKLSTGDNKASLSGFFISQTIFLNMDYYLSSDSSSDQTTAGALGLSSVFRIDPVVFWSIKRETIIEDITNFPEEPTDRQYIYKLKENQVGFGLHLKGKFSLTEKGNFILYVGWTPKIFLLQEYELIFDFGSYQPDVGGKKFQLQRNADISSGIIKTYLEDLSMGLTYHISPGCLVHFGIEATTDTQGKSTSLDLFRKVSLGLDYIF